MTHGPDSCVRCRTLHTPTRTIKGNGTARICINVKSCRRRQKAQFRKRARNGGGGKA